MKPTTQPGAGEGTDPKAGETPPADPKATATPGEPPADPADPSDEDDQSWDDKTKAYVKKLRGEAASNRKKAKDAADAVTKLTERFSGLESGLKKALGIEDDASPEEKAKALGEENATLAFNTAVLESALEHGIGKDQLKYYRFLISEKASELGENEELTDEHMEEILTQVKSAAGSKPAGGKTSVTPPAGGTTPPASGAASLTAEKFAKMTMGEKTALYVKDEPTYNALMAEARSKKLL